MYFHDSFHVCAIRRSNSSRMRLIRISLYVVVILIDIIKSARVYVADDIYYTIDRTGTIVRIVRRL